MKQVLIFKTGVTTCSEQPSYPGSMCPFVRVTNLGTRFRCGLYCEDLIDGAGGWLERLPQCMAQHRGVAEAYQHDQFPPEVDSEGP